MPDKPQTRSRVPHATRQFEVIVFPQPFGMCRGNFDWTACTLIILFW